MPNHNMKPLIEAVYRDAYKQQQTYQRGGICLVDAEKKILCYKAAEFSGGTHVEPTLLNNQDVKKTLGNCYKVYLFTYFAPCPNCTNLISSYSVKYPRAKWYLAYFAPVPHVADYNHEKINECLKKFNLMGWKVRGWSPAKYHPPAKLTKHDDLFRDETRSFSYPASHTFEEWAEQITNMDE